MNQPAICFRSVIDTNYHRIVNFQFPNELTGKVSHINFYYLKDKGGLFFFPWFKGWPLTGTTTDDLKDSLINPFLPDFYRNCFMYSIFDSNGKFLRSFGFLEPIFEKYKLGYAYVSPLVKAFDNEVYATSGNSGIIYKYYLSNLDLLIDSFKIFDINFSNFKPKYDYNKEPLLYIMDFQKIFNQTIVDLSKTDKYLYCLILLTEPKNGELTKSYFLAKYDLTNRETKYFMLPERYSNSNFNRVFLHHDNNNVFVGVVNYDNKKNNWSVVLLK